MKKLIVALLLAITIAGFAKQTHALSLDDLLQEIKGLKQQVVELKEQLGAAVLKATTASPATMSTAATSVTAIKQTKDLNAPGLIRRWQDGGCQVYDGNAWIGTISLNQGDCVKVFPASSVTTNNIQITTNPSSAGVVVNQAPATTAPAVNVPVTQPTKASFTHNLKVGEKSEEVTMLQKVLASSGYLSADNITGLYGKMTVAAVKAFQKDKGINDDGTIVGPKTQAAFGSNLGALGPITTFPGGSSLPCSVTNTTPQIKVISPNGGEVYQPGQQITIKWSTCNIPATATIRLDLLVAPFPPGGTNGVSLANTPNDGSEVITLPASSAFNGSPMSLGTNFKVFAWYNNGISTFSDLSDNLFTINGLGCVTGSVCLMGGTDDVGNTSWGPSINALWDVWSLDPITNLWTGVATSTPWGPRTLFGSASLNNKLWVMGGNGGNGTYNDVWFSSNGNTNSWTQVIEHAPWDARILFGTISFNTKLWVMGGFTLSGSKNDVWSSPDGVTWTQVTAAAPWTARNAFQAATFNNKIWVLGGLSGPNPSYLNDVWSSPDGVTWTQVTAAAPWAGRQKFKVIVFNNKLWVIGGESMNSSFMNDVWSSPDGVTWTQVTAAAPWAGRNSFMSFVANNKMWVVGGNQGVGASYTNDVWSSPDGVTWTQVTAAAPWIPRNNAEVIGL